MITDKTRSTEAPLMATTRKPGTFGMSRIDSIIGFRLGEMMNEINTLL